MIWLLLFCVFTFANGQSIQVTTVEGTIEGYTATDGDYYTFHGIPYAMSRVGADMFKPPMRLSALPGLFHANKSGIQCAHPSPDGMVGVIDCLVLNVFTSNVNTSRPVLVWVNGEESNPTVSSQYSFKRLIDEDMVVVTVNYRLSVFGFLCLGSTNHPGNGGLRDILMSLKWIQRNIAVFGGDPNNVILMGHGSAAAMVELITLVLGPDFPDHKNLVHKAIALSGSALAPWAVAYDPFGAVLALNRVLGGPYDPYVNSRDDIAGYLSSRSLNEINDALNQFKYANNTPMFAPCIEWMHLPDILLYGAPYHMLKFTSYLMDIPYIAAYMTGEGTQRAREAVFEGWLERLQSGSTDFLPVDLLFGSEREKRWQASNIRDFYFDNSATSSMDSYFNYHGDTITVGAVIRALQMRSRRNDVWLLEFGYMGTNNTDWNLDEIPLNKARHGSILNYIFGFDLKSATDENAANSIVKRISAFAYTGNPTPNDTYTFPVWRPFTNESKHYLTYRGSSELNLLIQETNVNPVDARMSFWDQLYNTKYNPPSSAVGLKGLLSVVFFTSILNTIL